MLEGATRTNGSGGPEWAADILAKMHPRDQLMLKCISLKFSFGTTKTITHAYAAQIGAKVCLCSLRLKWRLCRAYITTLHRKVSAYTYTTQVA